MNISNFSKLDRCASVRTPGIIVSLLLVLLFANCTAHNASPLTANAQPAAAAPALIADGAPQNSYADVVSRVSPAVVTVRSERRARAAQQFPFMDDPSLRDLFGDRLRRTPQQQQPEQRERGLGSGVIVNADGYILTNHHVVDGAEQIKVDTTDGKTFDAKLIGSDAPSDLAVLKIEAHNLPVLPLGDSDRVRVGDVALAIGNPLGIGQTVTMGIISAKGRATGLSDGSFEDFLQTDAPINRGNSGGALVNTNGELIGINSQILSPSGGSIGIGFSIPTNMARNVMDQLIKGGKVRRGKLGIGIQAITSDIATSLNLKDTRGAIVSQVEPGSPAEKAGVKRGDVVTAFNDSPVADSNSLRNQVARTQPGTEATLTVMRDGREQQLRVTLAELSVKANQDGEGGDNNGSGSSNGGGQFGMSLEQLTPDTAQRLGLRGNEQGLVISELDPSGAAAAAGLAEGDVILEVNRQAVRSASDFDAAMGRSSGRPALLLVNRRGNSIYLTLQPRQK